MCLDYHQLNSFNLEISKQILPHLFRSCSMILASIMDCVMLDSATFYGSAPGPGCSCYGDKKLNDIFTADTSDDEPDDSVPSEAQALLRGIFHKSDNDSDSDGDNNEDFFEVQEATRRLSSIIRPLPVLLETCASTTREVRNEKEQHQIKKNDKECMHSFAAKETNRRCRLSGKVRYQTLHLTY